MVIKNRSAIEYRSQEDLPKGNDIRSCRTTCARATNVVRLDQARKTDTMLKPRPPTPETKRFCPCSHAPRFHAPPTPHQRPSARTTSSARDGAGERTQPHTPTPPQKSIRSSARDLREIVGLLREISSSSKHKNRAQNALLCASDRQNPHSEQTLRRPIFENRIDSSATADP